MNILLSCIGWTVSTIFCILFSQAEDLPLNCITVVTYVERE